MELVTQKSSLVILTCITVASGFVAPSNIHHVVPIAPPFAGSSRIHQPNLRPVTSITSAKFGVFDDGHNLSTPLLVSALEATIGWTVKCLLLRRSSSLSIHINASSNRALLQGKLNNISISARDCIFRFRLLSFKRLNITAENLRLGYVPFILPFLPWIMWRLRRYIWFTIFTAQVMQMTGYLKTGSLRQMVRTSNERIYQMLAARQCTINYSLCVAKNDFAQSIMLRFWSQSILRSLVENSVVGAAAAVGDEMKRQRSQATWSGGVDSKNDLTLSSFNRNDSEFQPQQQGLLSATSFKLKDFDFAEGRVIFQAEAVMPKNENSRALPFTIRTKIEPTSLAGGEGEQLQQRQQQKNNAIGFISPECRMNTNPLIAGSLLGKLIPDVVWIPFGVGVAVPFGEGCQIYRAEVTDGNVGNNAGMCRIDGSLDIFPHRRNCDDDRTLARY